MAAGMNILNVEFGGYIYIELNVQLEYPLMTDFIKKPNIVIPPKPSTNEA